MLKTHPKYAFLPPFLVVFVIVLHGSSPVLADDTLRSQLRFDDGSGITASDSSTHGNDGTLINDPQWTTGQLGGALNFDGQDDHVVIDPASLSIESWTQITVGAWVKNAIGPGAGTDDIVGQWNFPGSPSWILTHHSNDSYFWEIAGKSFVTGGAVSTEWTQVVGVFDGTNMRLFVNAVEVATSAVPPGALPASTADVVVAGQSNGSNYFQGLIDEVRIYDRALSGQDILDWYNGTDPPSDTTEPSQPSNLVADAIDFTSAGISWSPSSDPDTGIDHYKIFRDGTWVAETTSSSFTDIDLAPGTSYTYEISAVNGAGLESSISAPLMVMTLTPDTSPPLIVSMQGSETSVVVEFDEALDVVSANDDNNYQIDNGVVVLGATLEADSVTVTLTTTAHVNGITYGLTVSGVEDLSGNAMPQTIGSYSVALVDPTFEAHWNFDEGSGTIAGDSGGQGNDGILVNGPLWATGQSSGALHFDGQDDRVIVDSTPLAMDTWGEITVATWVKNDIGAGAGTDDIASWWSFPSSTSWLLTHHGNDAYFWEVSGRGSVTGGTVGTDWTQVVGTYDGSTLRLYVNAALVSSQAGSSGAIPFSDADLVIGSQHNAANNFEGSIDDVRIYDRALTLQEVQDLFDQELPQPDITPPTLLSAEAIGSTEVRCIFDEALGTASAEDIANYSADNGIQISAAVLSGSSTVNLTTTAHTVGVTYTLAASGVKDAQGNAMGLQSTTYTFEVGDTFFDLLWALNNTGQTGGMPDADIDALEAWGIQTGSDQVVVAVLDSGVDYTHPDLASNIWLNAGEIPGNGIDDDGNGYIDDHRGWNFVSGDNDPMDDNGHGTHVAGIIGAVGNNGLGVSGVSQRVQIMSVKFIGSDNIGSIQGAIDAIDYAVAMGADVINNSWVISAPWNAPGWDQPGFAPELKAAIERANAAGVLFVAASGNFQVNTDVSPRHPASYDNDNIISVTATDQSDILLSFANFGVTTIDLGAPGIDIYSSVPTGNCTHCDPSGYNYIDGSSMSTAYVSGTAALLRAQFPTLGHLQIKTLILESGDSLASLQGKTLTGKRLNAFNALEAGNIPPSAIIDLAISGLDSSFVDVTFTAVGADGLVGTAAEYDLRHSTMPIDTINFGSATRVLTSNPQNSGTVELLRISGLLPSTTYYFAVKAIDNAANTGPISNIASATTLQGSAPSSVTVQLTMDDGSGSTAIDSSGNGNDGSLAGGPVWTAGRVGGALDFDGQDDRVVIDSVPLSMDLWSEITVAAWVKNDIGAGAGTDDIATWWNYPSSKSWVLTHHRNDKYFWEIDEKGAISGGTVSTNWTHVAGTFDGSTMRLHVDGIEVGSIGGLSGTLPFSAADLVIASQDNMSNYFDGIIDDFRIYDRALSTQELQDIVAIAEPSLPTVTVIATATPGVGPAPLSVQFQADGQSTGGTVGGTIVSYAWIFGDGGTSSEQNPVYIYNFPDMYTAEVTVTDSSGVTATDTVSISATNDLLSIDVWYGSTQKFGSQGHPQAWANILGNAFDPTATVSLFYSLNGQAEQPLSSSPDSRRLAMTGDFNVEIDRSLLQDGLNDVLIRAIDALGTERFNTVTIDYDSASVWPLPYFVDWAIVTDLQDSVQVTDGLWDVTAQGIRILEPAYHRMLTVGNETWNDYEITLPITIHGFDPNAGGVGSSAGFGITFRWTGHTNDPEVCTQPRCGWLPSGAGAWYDIGQGGPLSLDGEIDSSVSMAIGDTHYWKMRVETNPGTGSLYSLKVWEASQPEPAGWNLQKQRDLSDEPLGSIVLDAHHVDLTIGNIDVVPAGLSIPDTDPPAVLSVTANLAKVVTVVFSESVESTSATDISNYFIAGITVSDANLESDSMTVSLTTSVHAEGVEYTLDVSNVRDTASSPNVMQPVSISYKLPLAPEIDLRFDEGSGTLASDSSGNGHDGNLVDGAAWFSDSLRGIVLDLDGQNDQVVIDPAPLAMDTWNGITVAAWVKNDTGTGAGTNDIVSWWNWNGFPCDDCSFVLTHHRNNQYFWEINGTNVSGGSVSTDWTHVAATYDGAAMRLYVNGIELDSTPYSGGIGTSSVPLIIGGEGDGSDNFEGLLDSVQIYNRALSVQEINEIADEM